MLNITFDVWSVLFTGILLFGVFVLRKHNTQQAKLLFTSLAHRVWYDALAGS